MAKPYPRVNFLFSHAYLKGQPTMARFALEMTPYCNVLIDSGAFTNASARIKGAAKGVYVPQITVDEYIDVCSEHYHKTWGYVALDVLEDPENTQKNLDAMVKAKLRPMPVYVVGEDISVVQDLVKVDNGRVCVAGGAAASKLDYMCKRFNSVFEASDGKARIHGLGFVRFPYIYQLPIYTMDSSSFAAGGQYGLLSWYDPQRGFMGLHWKNLDKPEAKEFKKLFARCNIGRDVFSDPENTRRTTGYTSFFTLNAYMNLMKHALRYNRGYFLSIAFPDWLPNFMGILEAKNGWYFDYKKAVDIRWQYADLIKEDPVKFVDRCIRTMKELTDWENNTLPQ